MFRQIIVGRWAPDATAERKQAFRHAIEGLRDIPEWLALQSGDDAGHFNGSFDFAMVMDFSDFDFARVYVAHPIHQAHVRDHGRQVFGERVVVQHEWSA